MSTSASALRLLRVQQKDTGFMLETLHLTYRFLLDGLTPNPKKRRLTPAMERELGRRLAAFYVHSSPTKFHHTWLKKKPAKHPAGKTWSASAAKAATSTSASSSAS